ncbi:MAG: hypothetical protein ABIH72_01590 [archaeon]
MELSKKSQTAIEFMIVLGSALFFFTLIFLVINENIADKNREKETIIVSNLAKSVQDEINLASEASNGYYREFFIADNIIGKDYLISVIESRIIIKTDKNAISLPVQNVTGFIQKGSNTIRKEDGIVYLN